MRNKSVIICNWAERRRCRNQSIEEHFNVLSPTCWKETFFLRDKLSSFNKVYFKWHKRWRLFQTIINLFTDGEYSFSYEDMVTRKTLVCKFVNKKEIIRMKMKLILINEAKCSNKQLSRLISQWCHLKQRID